MKQYFYYASLRVSVISLVCLFAVGFICPQNAHAAGDTSFGIANYLPVTDKTVFDGAIISFSPKGYFLSKTEYDSLIVGVVTANPAVSLEITGGQKTYPVVSTGDTGVRVSTSNGKIHKGDPITTSSTPGVGMKATRTGYIIGAALDDYTSSNTKTIGKIPVTINIHYYVAKSSVNIGLFDVLNLSTLATYEEPIQAFRYFVAALVLILSFVFAFFSFARTANKGLEAIGRNPLAGRMIQAGILMNIAIAIAIVVAGLIIAFIVIRL